MGALDSKRAVVTGAGQGLGRAYAEALAREGARLIINDVDADNIHEVAQGISEEGGQAEAIVADVSDWTDAGRIVSACVERYGGIDVLVNNAGVYIVKPIWESTEEDFDHIIAVNLKGPFNMARHAIDRMMAQGGGCVVNITSGAASGLPNRSIYGASKGGIASFTYNWAIELAPHNIRVNAVSPMASTPMSAVHGSDNRAQWPPENVAPLVVFLASDDASYVTGQAIRLEGQILSLMNHPKPTRPTTQTNGWTIDAFRTYFKHAIGSNLEPVGLLATRYRYYDGVGKG